jgi:hypothetical protein
MIRIHDYLQFIIGLDLVNSTSASDGTGIRYITRNDAVSTPDIISLLPIITRHRLQSPPNTLRPFCPPFALKGACTVVVRWEISLFPMIQISACPRHHAQTPLDLLTEPELEPRAGKVPEGMTPDSMGRLSHQLQLNDSAEH